MFTLFDLSRLLGTLFGLGVGIAFGWKYGGVIGAGVGAIVGWLVGTFVGDLPWKISWWFIRRDLAKLSVDELRAALRGESHLGPNCLLLELVRRGQDIRCELPVILKMLVADEFDRRVRGWAALTTAFPAEALQLRDYRVSDPADQCRSRVARLHPAIDGLGQAPFRG